MRPIKLKVKGLNSFIDEQDVNFEELTSRGLFGIFGPTGSGKSTVLDGITLALYGDIARKSSNYINSNCDRASVSFEFEISESTKHRYLVERGFKRNKNGGINTSGAKITDITDEKEVLAEGAKLVTKQCEDIIGLNIDDFTRTVVLPQGKFSEFLKLEGKDRREMLERLFNLKEYGDELSNKLSKEISKEKNNQTFLLGKLKGYEEINEDYFKEKVKVAKEADESLNKSKGELDKIEKTFKRSEEIWNLQLELQGHKYEENKLKLIEEEIKEKNEKVRLGESALKVSPYIISYENTLKEKKSNEEVLSTLSEELNKLKVQKEESEKELELALNEKDNTLPKLKVKEQQVKDALEEKKALDIIIDEIKKYTIKIEELENKYNLDETKLKENIEKRDLVNNDLKSKEEKYEELKIEDGLKEKVQQGLLLNQKYKSSFDVVKTNKEKIYKINTELEDLKQDKIKLKVAQEEKQRVLLDKNNELKELLKNRPGESKDLLELQIKLTNSRDSWSKFNQYTKDKQEAQNKLKELKESLQKKEAKKENLDKTLDELKSKFNQMQIESLAHKLRLELKENNPCPVCGSLDHQKENLVDIDVSEANIIEQELHKAEKELKLQEKKITELKTKCTSEEERFNFKIKEIENLGDDFKNTSVQDIQNEFNNLQKDIEGYTKQKEELEKLINSLKEENYSAEKLLNQVSTKLEASEKLLKMTKEEYEKSIADLEVIEVNLNNLKLESNVENFIEKNKEILKIEEERESLAKEIKELRSSLDTLEKNKDSINEEMNAIKERLVKGYTAVKEKENIKSEKIKLIKSKVEESTNLEELLVFIQNKINNIEVKFKEIQALRNKVYEKYQEIRGKYISYNTKKEELTKREVIDKENLEVSLKEEEFNSIDDAKSKTISKETIKEIKIKIEKYNENLNKVLGAIEGIVKKIDNREVSKEAWEEITTSKIKKEEDIQVLNEIKIKIDDEVKVIETKLKELKGLLKDKAELDHKLGILADLEKLFKGKKFVEHVASNRLKYVSIEASKKLKDITNCTYGLEVDADGRFIIRDYKNGGVQRDASTLSGGETFLASLALALALSAEIQLKGTAPLELFFLDEGFGTLDDELLEDVMSSFESLHNDKLKVGIISHVESIKNRVPRKLIVTPAKAGKGGSKVKIEVS